MNCCVVKGKTGLTPSFPMTIASQKDVLFAKMQEFDMAQRTVDRVRSEMHCIIAALPNERNPHEIGTPLTIHGGQVILHPQNKGDVEKRTPSSPSECSRDNRQNRPFVVVVPKLDMVDPKPPIPPATVEKSRKTRAKRASESEIRKAIKLVYDENVSQREAEITCKLPLGTLSRRKGKQIMEQYRKEWGTPTQVGCAAGVRRKDVESAFIYDQ